MAANEETFARPGGIHRSLSSAEVDEFDIDAFILNGRFEFRDLSNNAENRGEKKEFANTVSGNNTDHELTILAARMDIVIDKLWQIPESQREEVKSWWKSKIDKAALADGHTARATMEMMEKCLDRADKRCFLFKAAAKLHSGIRDQRENQEFWHTRIESAWRIPHLQKALSALNEIAQERNILICIDITEETKIEMERAKRNASSGHTLRTRETPTIAKVSKPHKHHLVDQRNPTIAEFTKPNGRQPGEQKSPTMAEVTKPKGNQLVKQKNPSIAGVKKPNEHQLVKQKNPTTAEVSNKHHLVDQQNPTVAEITKPQREQLVEQKNPIIAEIDKPQRNHLVDQKSPSTAKVTKPHRYPFIDQTNATIAKVIKSHRHHRVDTSLVDKNVVETNPVDKNLVAMSLADTSRKEEAKMSEINGNMASEASRADREEEKEEEVEGQEDEKAGKTKEQEPKGKERLEDVVLDAEEEAEEAEEKERMGKARFQGLILDPTVNNGGSIPTFATASIEQCIQAVFFGSVKFAERPEAWKAALHDKVQTTVPSMLEFHRNKPAIADQDIIFMSWRHNCGRLSDFLWPPTEVQKGRKKSQKAKNKKSMALRKLQIQGSDNDAVIDALGFFKTQELNRDNEKKKRAATAKRSMKGSKSGDQNAQLRP
ncbi:hypothetical protein EJ08DRAFT_658510 [Tothia fuscella]|uniref:Uncharacterized protein n=1 Tax=Tothia fuscella TaxID=1048955 RepID=A0A9P4NX40_9PEZI|nr:hypothetical protein EJ08DRAFT_658510 [Tothia fuscella]